MTKIPAWSYSSLTMFDQCPKKYYHLRVAKDIKDQETDAIRYGKDLHLAAENYVRDDTPLPGKYSFIQPMLDRLKAIPGEKLCEQKMGIKKQDGRLVACDFFDKDVWFRGVADLLIIDREKKEARVVDYKTGKSARYADPKQLALMAACVFIHYPEVEKVRGGLLFVVSKDFIKADYEADTYLKIFSQLDGTLMGRQIAYETGVFNPKVNFSCRGWCPVLDCQHNTKGQK